MTIQLNGLRRIHSINNTTKYIRLARTGQGTSKSDLEKFQKARKLQKYIDPIRREYESKLKSKNMYDKQLGTAVWILDRLGNSGRRGKRRR